MAEMQKKIELLQKTEIIPLQSPILWCKYYRLMGRNKKADLIERSCQTNKFDSN